MLGEFEIVHAFVETHEVCCDRDVRSDRFQCGLLLIEADQPRVRGEACPVQFLSGVSVSGRMSRRLDLIPIPIDLTPKCRAPCEVKFLERAIAFFEPRTKRSGGVITITLADVTSVFVVHVPHLEGGMILVTFGKLRGDTCGVLTVIRIVWTVMPARTVPERDAIGSDREHLGVLGHHPCGRGCGGRGEIDRDAVRMEQVHELIEPGKIEDARLGLHFCP